MTTYHLCTPDGSRLRHDDGSLAQYDDIGHAVAAAHNFYEILDGGVDVRAMVSRPDGDHSHRIELRFVSFGNDCVAQPSGSWRMKSQVFPGGANIAADDQSGREKLLKWMERIAAKMDKRVQALTTRRAGQ